MSDNSSGGGGGGCGCISAVLFMLMIWALWFGLPVNGKSFEIDIFPPAIRFK